MMVERERRLSKFILKVSWKKERKTSELEKESLLKRNYIIHLMF